MTGTALAVAALMMAAPAPKKDGKATAQVKCGNVNECKGKGACGGATTQCAGTNECKGKGWILVTEKECKDKKGTLVP